MQNNGALNAVCPYYTMYPLSLPLGVLRRHGRPHRWVLDPFCGRGTTNFAARLLDLPSVGIDSSPIAVAISEAKLASASESHVIGTARRILEQNENVESPQGDFWQLCYHEDTLREVCQIRASLLRDCRSDSRKLLRAILLGALHGPRTKIQASHLSNQSPRTFSPKPAYAVRFWRERRMRPPRVKLLDVLETRAARYLRSQPRQTQGQIVLGDSRCRDTYPDHDYSIIVTSPPYYGMRTYIPDQWLRNWFLGAAPKVIYAQPASELTHGSADAFSGQLRSVWQNLACVCSDDAMLVIRFGGINDRKQSPLALAKRSMMGTRWSIRTARRAGDANHGKRQAAQFGQFQAAPLIEYDIYATLRG